MYMIALMLMILSQVRSYQINGAFYGTKLFQNPAWRNTNQGRMELSMTSSPSVTTAESLLVSNAMENASKQIAGESSYAGPLSRYLSQVTSYVILLQISLRFVRRISQYCPVKHILANLSYILTQLPHPKSRYQLFKPWMIIIKRLTLTFIGEC